jgi:hypothetical protein
MTTRAPTGSLPGPHQGPASGHPAAQHVVHRRRRQQPEPARRVRLRVEIDEQHVPDRASAADRLIAVVVLPTPPFWLMTPITGTDDLQGRSARRAYHHAPAPPWPPPDVGADASANAATSSAHTAPRRNTTRSPCRCASSAVHLAPCRRPPAPSPTPTDVAPRLPESERPTSSPSTTAFEAALCATMPRNVALRRRRSPMTTPLTVPQRHHHARQPGSAPDVDDATRRPRLRPAGRTHRRHRAWHRAPRGHGPTSGRASDGSAATAPDTRRERLLRPGRRNAASGSGAHAYAPRCFT